MTTETTIQEQNNIIAEFMGFKPRFVEYPNPKLNSWQIDRHGYWEVILYHSSWDWLMPVVEKIEQGNIGFKMCRKVVEIYYDDSKEQILRVKEKSRLESLYKAVVAFIKLLNGQNITL